MDIDLERLVASITAQQSLPLAILDFYSSYCLFAKVRDATLEGRFAYSVELRAGQLAKLETNVDPFWLEDIKDVVNMIETKMPTIAVIN